MLKHDKLRRLDDCFLELDKRPVRAVYFQRICGYNREIGDFILKYYQAARTSGVVIEGRIPNPDEKNLSYYQEMMGTAFQMNVGFIDQSLRKWLPRMTPIQRKSVADAIYHTLDTLRQSGKNENMLKNAYIKMMCWLYYKFERVVSKLGDNTVPKVLYEGEISRYELLLLSILSGAGCDIILLQYKGDTDYLKLDPSSEMSDLLQQGTMTSFPQGYCLKFVRDRMQQQLKRERLYGQKSELTACTNAWCSGNILEDVLKPPVSRSSDDKLYCNCFCRMNGVEDKMTFQSELIRLHQELKSTGRGMVIVNGEIPQPKPEEINAIKRENYPNRDSMLVGLAAAITADGDSTLSPVVRRAFIDLLLDDAEEENLPLAKTMNKAVHLICWYRRYRRELFDGWKTPEVGCFIFFGPCGSENEALFLRFLSRLPVDVLLFNPALNSRCGVEDPLLYEENHDSGFAIQTFPDPNAAVRVGTAAYHAERELDTLMYQDSGMYRDMQHDKASPIILSTMYEEIALLWDQELKYRPNFNADNNGVIMPVIFAKISGVKDGHAAQYWSSIKALITPETLVIKRMPFIPEGNPFKDAVRGFFFNGKLQRDRIRSHKNYQYGFLRESMQDHILDKIEMLVNQKLIKGTFEKGTEFTIISVGLSMRTEIVRMIQKFDFTKKNPKVIYINTGEKIISLEDAILMELLSLIGFDVLFFIPTGYQNVENHYAQEILEEHQIGSYLYDLRVPDFKYVTAKKRQSWRDKIFKRGK